MQYPMETLSQLDYVVIWRISHATFIKIASQPQNFWIDHLWREQSKIIILLKYNFCFGYFFLFSLKF